MKQSSRGMADLMALRRDRNAYLEFAFAGHRTNGFAVRCPLFCAKRIYTK
jgi:hypothetical protein